MKFLFKVKLYFHFLLLILLLVLIYYWGVSFYLCYLWIMKRTLLLILCFLLVVLFWIAIYFFFLSTPDISDINLEDPSITLSGVQYSGSQTIEQNNSGSFEESFYQDLSDFFHSDTNYYQNIEGEYWFIQP